MIRLQDGHTAVDLAIEPDRRVRMTISEAGEVIAAPTFAPADFLRIAGVARLVKLTSLKDAALASIARGLGWTPDQRPHWPVQVLEQLERDGLTITRIDEVGETQ